MAGRLANLQVTWQQFETVAVRNVAGTTDLVEAPHYCLGDGYWMQLSYAAASIYCYWPMAHSSPTWLRSCQQDSAQKMKTMKTQQALTQVWR